MNKIMTEQELLACFDDAIRFHHIFVTYQPKINHATGRMVGAEALMRWTHLSFRIYSRTGKKRFDLPG